MTVTLYFRIVYSEKRVAALKKEESVPDEWISHMADIHSDCFRVGKTETFGYMTKNKKGDMNFAQLTSTLKKK